MSKDEKLLAKMRTNPRDWRIKELESVAKRFGVDLRTVEFSTRDELVQKLRQAPDGGTQAIVMLTSPITPSLVE